MTASGCVERVEDLPPQWKDTLVSPGRRPDGVP